MAPISVVSPINSYCTPHSAKVLTISHLQGPTTSHLSCAKNRCKLPNLPPISFASMSIRYRLNSSCTLQSGKLSTIGYIRSWGTSGLSCAKNGCKQPNLLPEKFAPLSVRFPVDSGCTLHLVRVFPIRYIKSETISYYIFGKNLVQGAKFGVHSDLMQNNLVEIL